MTIGAAVQGPAEPGASTHAKDDPAKVRDAAQQFEALLISEILRSVRESAGSPSGDSSGECATGFAEEQFAVALARGGGLGLADLIVAGLEKSGS
jgi:flagellar protein FlgJ